jgi:hypothetical protein
VVVNTSDGITSSTVLHAVDYVLLLVRNLHLLAIAFSPADTVPRRAGCDLS